MVDSSCTDQRMVYQLGIDQVISFYLSAYKITEPGLIVRRNPYTLMSTLL